MMIRKKLSPTILFFALMAMVSPAVLASERHSSTNNTLNSLLNILQTERDEISERPNPMGNYHLQIQGISVTTAIYYKAVHNMQGDRGYYGMSNISPTENPYPTRHTSFPNSNDETERLSPLGCRPEQSLGAENPFFDDEDWFLDKPQENPPFDDDLIPSEDKGPFFDDSNSLFFSEENDLFGNNNDPIKEEYLHSDFGSNPINLEENSSVVHHNNILIKKEQDNGGTQMDNSSILSENKGLFLDDSNSLFSSEKNNLFDNNNDPIKKEGLSSDLGSNPINLEKNSPVVHHNNIPIKKEQDNGGTQMNNPSILSEENSTWYCPYWSKYLSPECERFFYSEDKVEEHVKDCHLIDWECDYAKTRIRCNQCDKSYKHKHSLLNHKNIHTGKYKCIFCNKRYVSSKRLKAHHKKKHTNRYKCVGPVLKPEQTYSCGLCTKKYCTRKALDDHLNDHIGLKPYGCGLCFKRFDLEKGLEKHAQLIHMRQTSFSCDYAGCNYKSDSAYVFSEHLKGHKEYL